MIRGCAIILSTFQVSRGAPGFLGTFFAIPGVLGTFWFIPGFLGIIFL